MTDRELLELAAKAAGIDKKWTEWRTARIGKFQTIKYTKHEGFNGWNPLEDDGDALRLAVNLRLRVEINERSIIVSWIDNELGDGGQIYEYPDSEQNDDYKIVHINHDKATRRAIVRAAAEIGKSMGD